MMKTTTHLHRSTAACPLRSTSRPPRHRRGAAAVEFAFIAPFLLLLLVGMLEFGRALMVQQVLHAAAREGAREAVLPGATTESVEEAVTRCTSASNLQGVDTTVTPDPETAESGDRITVRVDMPFRSVTRMFTRWFNDGFILGANSVMRKEGFD